MPSINFYILPFMIIPNGFIINETTDWKPVWSFELTFYFIIATTILSVIPSLLLTIKIYTKFDDNSLKKKYRFFIIGLLGYFINSFTTPISNYINDPNFRLINSIIGLCLFIFAPFLYYGVGKQIEK